ncbi:hypothetical protein CMUS01_12775 [Colletotrichum musicola]|uniref:Uncharacterized protein n=1 Tax=Colletotrichum musicola TaxID=2175873 RepID=A0A8H6JJB2_9PEZI|nr:hypothetical protein CMUS01_12775 [Colletotrichum musicola]
MRRRDDLGDGACIGGCTVDNGMSGAPPEPRAHPTCLEQKAAWRPTEEERGQLTVVTDPNRTGDPLAPNWRDGREADLADCGSSGVTVQTTNNCGEEGRDTWAGLPCWDPHISPVDFRTARAS